MTTKQLTAFAVAGLMALAPALSQAQAAGAATATVGAGAAAATAGAAGMTAATATVVGGTFIGSVVVMAGVAKKNGGGATGTTK